MDENSFNNVDVQQDHVTLPTKQVWKRVIYTQFKNNSTGKVPLTVEYAQRTISICLILRQGLNQKVFALQM